MTHRQEAAGGGRQFLGGGGGGGRLGGGGAVVVVLQLQFIDKVVDVLLQLKFQQSRCRRLFLRRRSCDQQRQVPTVQRFESSCP